MQLTHLQRKKDTLQEALNITEAPPALPDNEIAVQEHFFVGETGRLLDVIDQVKQFPSPFSQ